MSCFALNILLLALGSGGLWYAIRSKRPRPGDLVRAFLTGGIATVGFVVFRQQRALDSHAVSARPSWLAEMLFGGAPLVPSPIAGLERASGVAVWLVVWALAVYLDFAQDENEEPGSWALALLPPLLFGVFVFLLPVGPALPTVGSDDATGALKIAGGVFVGYVLAVMLYRKLRSRA